MSMRGARYLHVLVPCPLGWGTASCDTIRVARLATAERPVPGVRGPRRRGHRGRRPIRHRCRSADYLRAQARYRHLFQPEPHVPTSSRAIEDRADRNIDDYGLHSEARAS